MKEIIMIMVLISTQLLANNNFDIKNTVKIDMHGGKSEKLTDNTSKFSEMKMNNFKGLQNISIKKINESKDLKEKKDFELEDIIINK
ncbi:MAG: hypothetical protein WA945_08300 [Arcobacteraceae bacterium]